MITAFAMLYLSYYIRFGGEIPSQHRIHIFAVLIMFALGFWLFLLIFGVYGQSRFLDIHIFRKLLLSQIIHIIVVFSIILFYNMYSSDEIFLSRWVFFIYFFLTMFSFLILRTLISSFQEVLLKKKLGLDSILIISSGKISKSHARRIQNILCNRFNILSNTRVESKKIDYIDIENQNILNIIEQYSITCILFLHPKSIEPIREIINQTSNLDLDYWIDSESIKYVSSGYKLLPIEGIPYFEIIIRPIYGINIVLKRSFDLMVSIILIILTLPLYFVIPVLIKMDSKGPVFFSQIRLGLKGAPIKIIKFRTMKVGAESESGPKWAEKNDPRVTGIGGFLRRFSIDEIPQLFQVLMGKLSFIGPRPERPYFVEKHPAFKGIRLLIKPGLTGLAQINGRYDLSLEEKLNFDLYYINNYSFWLDIEIFFKSIFIIIFQKGAR